MNFNQQPLSSVPPPPPPNEWHSGPGRFPSGGQYQPGRGNLPTPLVSGMSGYGPDGGNKMNMMGRSPHAMANMNMGSPTSTTSGMGGPRGPEYRNGPSPPNSDGRLSTSTSVSVNNFPPEVRRRNQQAMEETLFHHYNVIKQFLGPHLREINSSSGPPSRAKDKLLRLSSVQFHELSTDVYDELQRRSSTNPNTQPYLPAKPHYHPKRNQARQKLSTLPDQRFQTLAADALFELERRHPQFTGQNIDRRGSPATSQRGGPNRSQTQSPLSPVGPPQGFGMRPRGDSSANGMPYQRSLQQNTMVPNKSYLVEDDDESADNISLYGGGKRDTSATHKSGVSEKIISEYQNKVEELQKELEIKTAAAALKDDLEKQLNEAQALNDEIKLELEKIKVEKEHHENEAKDLKDQHEQLETMHEDLQNDYEALKSEAESKSTSEINTWREKLDKANAENRSLRDQVDEQSKVTQSVKQEAEGFLAEMKSITISNSEALRKEEELRKRNETLIDELALWKDRYARMYASNHASENGGGIVQTQTSFRQFMSPDGVIDPSHISSFHHSVDELLRMVRQQIDSTELQNQMRSTIAKVRAILADVDKSHLNIKQQAFAEKGRSRVSATANNLITAVRNHGHGANLLPVSLVDAAASHLASAVADLVHAVKLRPTNEVYEHDSAANTPVRLMGLDGVDESSTADEEGSLGSYFKSDPSLYRTSATESIYSTNTVTRPQSHRVSTRTLDKALPPIVPDVPALQTVREPEPVIETKPASHGVSRAEIEQLKNYLEDQTATMTSSIQALVSTIRVSSTAREVGTNLASVTSTLGSILSRLSQEPKISNLDAHTAKLISAHETLRAKGQECDNVKMEGQKWKSWCSSLPPVAFGVARELREVLAELEPSGGNNGHDEFR